MSATTAPVAASDVPSLLELEITGLCQLRCGHCYADSGPHGGHGTMTAEDWEKIITQAAALGIRAIQFIGGETHITHHTVQGLGRAASGSHRNDPAQLCGHCGSDRFAIMTDGTVTPCVMSRWLATGNARHTPLANILAGPHWQHAMTAIPAPRTRPAPTANDGLPQAGHCPPQDDSPTTARPPTAADPTASSPDQPHEPPHGRNHHDGHEPACGNDHRALPSPVG